MRLTNSGSGAMSISTGATLSTSGALTNSSATGITVDGTLTETGNNTVSNLARSRSLAGR